MRDKEDANGAHRSSGLDAKQIKVLLKMQSVERAEFQTEQRTQPVESFLRKREDLSAIPQNPQETLSVVENHNTKGRREREGLRGRGGSSEGKGGLRGRGKGSEGVGGA